MSLRYSYLEWPEIASSVMKGLKKIRNNDRKCFRWRHTRHCNSLCQNLNIFTKSDKQFFQKT